MTTTDTETFTADAFGIPKHALLLIMLVAAIITPPDLMTLILVSIPLYILYEISIRVARRYEKRSKYK
ncbi:MAG: hypothetical protein LUD00_12275 [Prevotellaceae bacterium]|nr:hypothetical protein [Prevotellaceae bacterium]